MVHLFFIKPLASQKLRIVTVLISLILLSASQSLLLLLLGPFIKAMLGLSPEQLMVSMDQLLPVRTFDFFPELKAMSVSKQALVVGVPTFLLGAAWLRNLAMYFYQLNTAALALFIAKSYRDRIFVCLLHKPFLYISKKSPAQWMSYLMNDVLYLQTRFSDILNSFLRDGCVILAAYISLLFIHFPTGVFLLLISPFIAAGMGKTGKKIAYFAEVFQRELANMADLILEIRRRFEFIRAQGGEKRDFGRFSTANEKYYQFIKKSLMVRAIFAPFMEFIGFFLFALILYAYAQGLIANDFSAENLIVFFGALGLVFKPLRNLGEQIAKFQETKGSLVRSFEVFDGGDHQEDKLLISGSTDHLPETISIDKVRVTYQDSKRGFAAGKLRLYAGKSVAIVGPSGSGKSTLLKSFAGLLSPEIWEANISWNELRKHVSMVSQAPFLFQESLRENLLYGHPSKDQVTDDDIWEALGIACAEPLVQKLHGKLSYQVSAVMKNLSGGQLQRLVIARALLRHQNIWLFDEATSALDSQMEQDLLELFVKQSKSNAKFFIAVTHRLQFIDLFDEVWFVEQGSLVAKGTHRELMENQRYKLFYGASKTSI